MKPKSDSESVETRESKRFPIVGIGASAGGLAAFELFFSGFPEEPGMAFVLVQHLSPDHQSNLAEILQKHTSLQVFEVADDLPIQANRVYIIPPDKEMILAGRRLRLCEPHTPRGHRLPIDLFFAPWPAN